MRFTFGTLLCGAVDRVRYLREKSCSVILRRCRSLHLKIDSICSVRLLLMHLHGDVVVDCLCALDIFVLSFVVLSLLLFVFYKTHLAFILCLYHSTLDCCCRKRPGQLAAYTAPGPFSAVHYSLPTLPSLCIEEAETSDGQWRLRATLSWPPGRSDLQCYYCAVLRRHGLVPCLILFSLAFVKIRTTVVIPEERDRYCIRNVKWKATRWLLAWPSLMQWLLTSDWRPMTVLLMMTEAALLVLRLFYSDYCGDQCGWQLLKYQCILFWWRWLLFSRVLDRSGAFVVEGALVMMFVVVMLIQCGDVYCWYVGPCYPPFAGILLGINLVLLCRCCPVVNCSVLFIPLLCSLLSPILFIKSAVFYVLLFHCGLLSLFPSERRTLRFVLQCSFFCDIHWWTVILMRLLFVTWRKFVD